ncbi:MAG: hypothetical protein E7016_04855 [Alphaproteobacteria bacterium]|nr:hypothetical protein [Alphaproteobacteria bacterium]
MRKYFLLSAVALMVATNVNAESYVQGSITAEARLVSATGLDCSDLNFGTIVTKANRTQVSRVITDLDTNEFTGDIIDVINPGYGAYCQIDGSDATPSFETQRIMLYHESGSGYVNLKIETGADYYLRGELSIPQTAPDGLYTGTVTVVATY